MIEHPELWSAVVFIFFLQLKIAWDQRLLKKDLKEIKELITIKKKAFFK